MMERRGILAAGNWIVDRVKLLDCYPHQDGLASILSVESSNGGAAYNILKDLTKLGANFPLAGAGIVGQDPEGDRILEECDLLNIDTQGLIRSAEHPTSYTDVMTDSGTGRRTFFHNRGANAFFTENDVALEQSRHKIFHLGYFLLLDKLDEIQNGMTGAARLLENAHNQGFITSADVVSEASDRFKTIVPISLPFLDYLFINEYEVGKTTGVDLAYDEPSIEQLKRAGKVVFDMGLHQWVFIHFVKGVFAMHKSGQTHYCKAQEVLSENIKGSAGAGDALAAGILFGMHEGWEMPKVLKLGVGSAASSLLDPTCSNSIKRYTEIFSE